MQRQLSSNSYLTSDSSNITEICKDNINISIWKRQLELPLKDKANTLLSQKPHLQFSEVLSPDKVVKILNTELDSDIYMLSLYEDISRLVEMFRNLFDLNEVWLRIDAIDNPMCPRFHTDRVKCRLVTTYAGPGTQWLSNNCVDRMKLGHGNEGLSDEQSGLFRESSQIEQLDIGDVALLKGEAWEGNEGSGIVHRSPHVRGNYKRLYVTIDFVDLYLSIYRDFLKKN